MNERSDGGGKILYGDFGKEREWQKSGSAKKPVGENRLEESTVKERVRRDLETLFGRAATVIKARDSTDKLLYEQREKGALIATFAVHLDDEENIRQVVREFGGSTGRFQLERWEGEELRQLWEKRAAEIALADKVRTALIKVFDLVEKELVFDSAREEDGGLVLIFVKVIGDDPAFLTKVAVDEEGEIKWVHFSELEEIFDGEHIRKRLRELDESKR